MQKLFYKNLYKKIQYSLLIILLSFYIINFITKYTFLSPMVMGGDDSCVFVTIGFSWLNNVLPYRDLFDHKGPILYLINMVGFSFFNNEIGIIIIEIIFSLLWVSLTLILFKKNILIGTFFILILFEILLKQTFEGGNYTEEYSILFNVISVFLYFTPIKKSYWKYIVYGIVACLCFYMRPNTSAPTLAIFILECSKNFYFKRIIYITFFVGFGFFLTSLPINIYFYLKDSLYILYQALLLQNIYYTAESILNWHTKFLNFILSHINWGIVIFLQFLVLFYMNKFRYLKKSLFITLFTLILGLISLRTYSHYLMMATIPYIFVCHLFFLIPKKQYIIYYKKIYFQLTSSCVTKEKVFFLTITILIIMWYGSYSLNLNYNVFSQTQKENYNKYFSNIGLSSNSKILNLGTHKDTSIFYYLHVLPQERSFFPQIIQPKGEEYDVYKNIDKILKSNKYDVVLLPSHIDIDLKKYGFNPVGKFKDSLIFKKN